MPCDFPNGPEETWCAEHRANIAMVRALREEGESLKPALRVRAP